MNTVNHHVMRGKVDQAGRLMIPADIRHELQIDPGDEVILEVAAGGFTVSTFKGVVREVQEFLAQRAAPGGSVVEELIAERQADAARE